MTSPILRTTDLTVRFGGHVAVDNVSCAFHANQLTAIVGPNGAGKTTYFNLISGQIPVERGQSHELNSRQSITRPVGGPAHPCWASGAPFS